MELGDLITTRIICDDENDKDWLGYLIPIYSEELSRNLSHFKVPNNTPGIVLETNGAKRVKVLFPHGTGWIDECWLTEAE